MPDPKPLLTRPRVMLATLRNRQGGLKVSWTGALRGGRWSSLLAMAAKRSPLLSLAPRKVGSDPGRLTHSGRVTTVRDESASVEAQTLIPNEPKPNQPTMLGWVSMPQRESTPKPQQPPVPEQVPVVVVTPLPTPPPEVVVPPPLLPPRRLRLKSPPPPLKRAPTKAALTQGTQPQTPSSPQGKPTPPPKRFRSSRRPVRALLPPPLPPRPHAPTTQVSSGPLPQTPTQVSPTQVTSAPLRQLPSPPPTPPRLPPRTSKPLPQVPPRLGPTALGLTSTQLGADLALGLKSRVRSSSLSDPSRPPPRQGERVSSIPQGQGSLKAPTQVQGSSLDPRPPSKSPQSPRLDAPTLQSSPSVSVTPPPGQGGFGARLRSHSLPLGLAPILSRGQSPTQVRFTPELTTVLPSVEPITSPTSLTPPPREPTLLERARGSVSGSPPTPTVKTASQQLKEAHELSDRLDKVVASIPKAVVGQDPTTPPTVDLTPGRVTGSEALTQAHELSDRLDKITDSIHTSKKPMMGLKRMPRSGLLTPSPLVLGSVNAPTPMRSDDARVIVPDQVQGSTTTTTTTIKSKGGSLPRIPIARDTSPKSKKSSLDAHQEEASKLAKSATATWWPTWTDVPTRPPSTTALTERFARALQIADLRAQIAPSLKEKAELEQLEADEGADLYRFGSHILLDNLLNRPFKGELPKPPEARRGGVRGRANAMLARGPSHRNLPQTGSNPMSIWRRGVLRERSSKQLVVGGSRPQGSSGTSLSPRGNSTGTPRPMRDKSTPHTIIPDVPASMLDSVGTLDGNVGESSGSSSRSERFERSPRSRYEDKKTVLDAWRKHDIRDTDFEEDLTLARMAIEDLMYEEKVAGKRPDGRDRDLQRKLERVIAGGRSAGDADELASEIESGNLRPEERVRWHRASVLASKSRESWWPTWIDREVKDGRARPIPEPPSLRAMAARYVRALELVELRDTPNRTPEQKQRLAQLMREEVAQRDTAGSWLHLDMLLKRQSKQSASPGRKSGPTGMVVPMDSSSPIQIHDDVEQIVVGTRSRSSGEPPPPPKVTPNVPPVPKPPQVPVDRGGLEPDALPQSTAPQDAPDGPPSPPKPQPTVDQLLSAMDDTTLARLVQRVLEDKQAGGAVLSRAIDLLERRARFGALREVR